MNAATSEPRKFSPSPLPTTSGELRRAPTTTSGSSAETASRVNAPSSRRQTRRIASMRPPAANCSSRCATTSVSVSETIRCPASSSSVLRAAKFSMIPLWMTAIRPSQSVCGWALRSVGAPWVAHRVCPIPVVAMAGGVGRETSAERRLASFPARFSTARPSAPTRAIPAESYPRYSSRPSPSTATSIA